MIYSTSAYAESGRNGTATLVDGTLALPMATPGASARGHNPEQLFAMGYAACFDNAVKLTARRIKLPLKASKTNVTVGLKKDGESFKLDVTIDLETEGLDHVQQTRLLEAAHDVCPYSNALRGNVDLRVTNLQKAA